MKIVKPQARGFDAARLDQIKIWMERYVRERKFAGSSILIGRGGDEVYHATAGKAEQAHTLARQLIPVAARTHADAHLREAMALLEGTT